MLGTTGNPRIALSLDKLRRQINAAYPNRDKSWDGDLGDEAHRQRTSDHNPDNGVVHALDITSNAGKGLDGMALAEALRTSKDPRIKYVIHRGRIFSSTVSPWQWRERNQGPEDHAHHVHVSVNKSNGDQTQDWSIPGGGQITPSHPAPTEEPDGLPRKANRNIIATMFADNQVAYPDVEPGWNDRYGVALPAKFSGTRPTLWLSRNGKVARNVPIIDKGPHYDGTPTRPSDPYWALGTRPRAETATGKNGAGIDLTPPLDAYLACQGKCRLDWGFEPMEMTMPDTNPTVPTSPADPTNERLDRIIELLGSEESKALRKGIMKLLYPYILKVLPMLGIQGGIWAFVLNLVAMRMGWVDGATGGGGDIINVISGGAAGSGLIAWASRGLDRLAKVLDKLGGNQ